MNDAFAHVYGSLDETASWLCCIPCPPPLTPFFSLSLSLLFRVAVR